MLITFEEAFNNNFLHSTKLVGETYFEQILNYCFYQNYIDSSQLDAIYMTLQSGLSEYVRSMDKDEDFDEDIDTIRNNRFMKCIQMLDAYFNSMSPHDAAASLIECDVPKLITNSKTYVENNQHDLLNEMEQIKSSYVYKNHLLFKQTINDIMMMINNVDLCDVPYNIVMNQFVRIKTSNYNSVEKVLKCIRIENGIIEKIDCRIVDKLIRSLNNKYVKSLNYESDLDADDMIIFNNLCSSILTNYVYAKVSGIDFDELTENEIRYACDLKIDKNDLIEILINGELNLNDEEKDYIYKSYILNITDKEMYLTAIRKK